MQFPVPPPPPLEPQWGHWFVMYSSIRKPQVWEKNLKIMSRNLNKIVWNCTFMNSAARKVSQHHWHLRSASKIKLENVNKKRMATARRLIFLEFLKASLLIWLHCCFHHYKTLKAVGTTIAAVATAFRVLYWWRQQCTQISNWCLEIFKKIITLLTVTVLFLFTFFNLILDAPRSFRNFPDLCDFSKHFEIIKNLGSYLFSAIMYSRCNNGTKK